MKRILRRSLGVVFLAALSTCAGCSGDESLVGRELPAFDLQPMTPDARSVSVADLKGKVTLINFWATWCPPCVKEFPHLLRIADAHRGNGDFLFLSISSDNNHSAVEEFIKEKGYAIPIYSDVEGRTQNALPGKASRAIPVTLLLDRDAKVANAVVGFDTAKLDEIDLQIASLLRK